MPARLILNADDFGLTHGINRAVAELHQAGVLTSATLMANGPAFEDAVSIAKSRPALGVGCHIVLVDGTPLSPPDTIPTLLGSGGRTFRTSLLHFVRDLFFGRVDEGEMAREALAQVQKLKHAGINVTHVDTHKHTHIFPQVARPLANVLRETPVFRLRNPFEPTFARRTSRVDLKRRLQLSFLDFFEPQFHDAVPAAFTIDGTIGVAATGSLTEHTLEQLLGSLPTQGTYELCCHPGYQSADLDRIPTRLRATREIEREALLAIIPKILSLPNAPELIHYGNLLQ